MSVPTVLYSIEDGVAVITLNRPDRLNAWTPQMGDDLATAVGQAACDKEVKVIVLTGAGRGFCAGMDHENLSKTDENRSRVRCTVLPPEMPRASKQADFEGLFTYFPSVGKPLIAAINGPVAGSGLVLALACDVRFMDSNAVMTSAFARRGLVAEHGIAWLLANLVGIPTALDLLLSGRRVEAVEAKAMGLVNFVCPVGTTLNSALAYAKEMAKTCAPRSLQIIKRQVWNAAFEDLYRSTEIANQEMLQSFSAVDFKESQDAHATGRAPQFPGI